ncbi:replication initiation protein [Acinetobacter baumannii]|uniref:replication initiation protein n=1 Tax=Acinetobacter baumannii TaxID=470 RepID=UPI00148A8A3B|nr:replication initiation protein [Acinetobacter baumannii]
MESVTVEPGSRKNVTKSNDLVMAAYKLTLNEQRLLLAAISQIDPRKPMPRPISITAQDFSEQYGIPLKHAYEALKEATSALYERDIKTFDGRYKSRFRLGGSRGLPATAGAKRSCSSRSMCSPIWFTSTSDSPPTNSSGSLI